MEIYAVYLYRNIHDTNIETEAKKNTREHRFLVRVQLVE